MNLKIKYLNKVISLILISLFFSLSLSAQNVSSIDKKAQKYYDDKKFNEAIAAWLQALDIDPDNVKIQQKIEMVYEEKHRKDLSFQKSKIYLRKANETLNQKTFAEGEKNAELALENYVMAFRIAPNDSEILAIKERMELLRDRLRVEQRKARLRKELLELYNQYKVNADEAMNGENYEIAIGFYDKMLKILPSDIFAQEEKRKAEIALESRLKYEQLKSYFLAGERFMSQKKYGSARKEYEQILIVDPKNKDAKEFIGQIDDILDKQKTLELRRINAENAYRTGIENLKNDNFDLAEDNFKEALSMIKKYKDTEARLASIPALKKAYLQRIKRRQNAELDKQFQNGLFAMSRGDYKDAVAAFQKMITIDPKNENALKYVQIAKDALKQQQEEFVDENSPYYDIVNPLIVSGISLFEAGKYNESIKRWEQIKSIFPKNKIAGKYLLMCQFKLNPETYKRFAGQTIEQGKKLLKDKKYEQALYNFELIKEIDPKYPQIDRLIRSAKIVKKEAKAPKIPASQIRNLYNSAIRLYRSGNKTAALRNCETILQNDPENTQALILKNKIDAERRTGVASTTTTTRRLTAAQEAQVRRLYQSGMNYYLRNNWTAAIAEWRKVLAIDPNHVKAKNNIRRTTILLGQ